VHGSDSPENAEKEVRLFFQADELIDWSRHSDSWIRE
jgi:nucleoside-diphosphate kinase